MRTSIVKQFEFSSHHRLPYHQGKCSRDHGHNYLLEVKVSGEIQTRGSASGMIVDFYELTGIVQEYILDLYDHRSLNEFFDNPTAEIVALRIFQRLNELITKESDTDVEVEMVRLWETSTAYAEITH